MLIYLFRLTFSDVEKFEKKFFEEKKIIFNFPFTVGSMLQIFFFDEVVSRFKLWHCWGCGVAQSTVDNILASHPAAPGSNSGILKNFYEKILKLLRFITGTA